MKKRPLRVVLYGPESTGKSTLAARLAELFQAPWSIEYVRQYWDEHGGKITGQDLEAIARGQLAGEEQAFAQALANGARVVVHDTDLIACGLWDDLLFPGAKPTWLAETAERRAGRGSLYLFCDTDLPWTDDPQRCFPDAAGRAMCRQLWLDTAVRIGFPLVLISGDGAQREARAIAAVEAALAS